MPDSVCPECSSTNIVHMESSMIECRSCGYIGDEFPPLICPACGTINDYNVDACTQCGEPMSLFWQVLSRHTNPSQSLRLEQIRAQADKIKVEAQAASEKRYSEFEEIDRRRLQVERQEQLARSAQDRQLFITVGVALGIFALIILVLALVLGS